MRRSAEFDQVVRRGFRAGRPTLVVHLLRPDTDAPPPSTQAMVGFIVSKGVGTAVVRHRVTRQLRHLMAGRLAGVPAGARIVLRARPEAAGRTSAALGADLDRALMRLTGQSG